LRSGVGKFQSFEIMKDCCARGFDWLDFNPSAGLGGVKELKEQFRAEPLPAPLVYVDTVVKRMIRRTASLFDVRDAKINVSPLDGWVIDDDRASEPGSVVAPAAGASAA
jgi:hypothetical protein